MHPGLAIALILIVILVPGYAVLPWDYPKRLRLPFVVFAGVGLTSVVGLILLLAGHFSLWLLAVIETPLLLLRFRSGRWPGPGIREHLPVLALFVAVAAFAFVTAGEPYDANGDAGVYTISALHLEETGGWTWPLEQVIPPGVPEDLVISQPHLVRPWREVAPGFIVSGDRVVPQFFPLYSIWGAIFSTWLGIHGVLAVNILGALMLLLGCDALFRLLLGRFWRFAGLAAIVLNPIFLVFLKYPSAEAFLSGILAGWLFWMVLFLRRPTTTGAVMPAGLLALAILTKFFAWAVAGTVVIVLVLLPWHRARAAAVFFGLLAPAVLVDAWLAAPHLENHIGQLMILSGFKIVAVGCGGILLLRLVWNRVARWAPPALAVLYITVLVLLWLRSEASHVHDFAALSGPGVVWGGAAGLALYLWRRRSVWLVYPAAVFVLLSLFLFLGSGDSPFYPFAARRYLPITVTLGALFLAYVARTVAGAITRWTPLGSQVATTVCATLFAAALAPPLWVQGEAVALRQGAGFTATLRNIEEAIPDHTVVLATGQAWRYSPHLLLAGAPVFCLDLNRPGVLPQIADLLLDHSRSLVLASDRRDDDVLDVIPEYRPHIRATTHPPLAAGAPGGATFRLFGVERGDPAQPGLVDVGTDDHLRVAGVFGPELSGDRSFRWTGPTARIMVAPGDEVRFVWSRDGNPDNPLVAAVVADGVVVGYESLTGGWQTSRWIPMPDSDDPVLVEIHTPTFQPALQGRGNDRRNLGLRLDLVETR